MQPTFNRTAAIFAVGLTATVAVAFGQSMPPLTTSTPEYKCYVHTLNGEATIIRFLEVRTMPKRFSDAMTVSRAAIPESVRATLRQVHECILVTEQFADPTALALEQNIPQ